MHSRVLAGVALAAAAAVMFGAVTANTARACKGTGFLMMTKAECDAARARSPR
jgi:hypothetical protein